MRVAQQTSIFFCTFLLLTPPDTLAQNAPSTLLAKISTQQASPGISATFDRLTAVEDQDFEIPIRVLDSIGVIKKVIVSVTTPLQKDAIELSAIFKANSAKDEQYWIATLEKKYVPRAPGSLKISAVLMTKRNGIVLSMGQPDGYLVAVKTNERAQLEQKALQKSQTELQIEAPFIGGMGVVGLAGTTSRLRLLVGASGDITDHWGAGVTITVGPNFAQPEQIMTESPVAVGFEAVGHRTFRTVTLLGVDSFAEPFIGVDLRLPGTDLRAGLRYGFSWPWEGIARMDLSFGGGLSLFDAFTETQIGFTGGLQMVLWFADS